MPKEMVYEFFKTSWLGCNNALWIRVSWICARDYVILGSPDGASMVGREFVLYNGLTYG